MEDDQNGRRPKWKMTKMEDDQNGRRPKCTAYKGTIRAYFSNMHSQGPQTTNPNQWREKNGGGSRSMVSSLKTKMKKSHKSGNLKKMGKSTARGAKSRRKGEQLTREILADSSHTGIKKFFFKINGIIETGEGPVDGRILLGIIKNPLYTRN